MATAEVEREDTVVLSGDALSALRFIASVRGISISDALAQAIAREKTITEEVTRGGRVLIEKPDKSLRELVL